MVVEMRPKIVAAAAAAVAALVLVALLQVRRSPPAPVAVSAPEAAPAPPQPAPRIHVAAPATAALETPATNAILHHGFLNDGVRDLRVEQLAGYLAANHRNAESLLAAFQLTHDRSLLDEAITNFPNDPRVAFTAMYRAALYANQGDEDKIRRQWLDTLKQAAPDNALANYLSAANYFKTGQAELAVQEVMAGAAKPSYDDYVLDSMQSADEAYRAAGYSEADAKALSTSGALLPQMAELKRVGVSLVDLANTYQQAGDNASAQAALQMSLALGQRLDDPNALTLIQNLVGIAIEKKALDAMPADAQIGNTGQTAQDQSTALMQQRDAIKALVGPNRLSTWLTTASDADVISYFDRMRAFGEQNALNWMANRNAPQ